MIKKKNSSKSGTARMLELGYSPIQLWLSPLLRSLLKKAAAEAKQSMARYALEAIAATLPIAARTRGGRPE
jgi:hypothetical protein